MSSTTSSAHLYSAPDFPFQRHVRKPTRLERGILFCVDFDFYVLFRWAMDITWGLAHAVKNVTNEPMHISVIHKRILLKTTKLQRDKSNI